ncbi:MAG: serine/threonine protein kinase [Deltaproteobacteria bacterium]|nr:serine/threonine protein kinase [Deltaproteobacteria bacterium]
MPELPLSTTCEVARKTSADPESQPACAPATAAREWPDAAVAHGGAIGRYVVIERVGEGAMGVVYAAFDPDLDRRVAIKLLQPDGEAEAGSMGRARLLREAQALARLADPNVVAVYDVGTCDGRVFVAMEFVRGQTLTQWLAAAPRSREDIVATFVQAARGLAAAHDQGLMHRDFKPDNVMIGEDGRVRVMDFGLARSAGATLPGEPNERELATDPSRSAEPRPRADPSLRSDRELVSDRLRARATVDVIDRSAGLVIGADASGRVDVRLTRTGAMAGTPAYMAPEQHRGLDVDGRADQFAFCVALWEALYGVRPFEGSDRFSLAIAVCSGRRRPPPPEIRVPAHLRRALDRGLAVEPTARFASMHELLAALQPGRTRGPWLAAAALLGLGGLAVASLRPGAADPCADAAASLASVWSPARRDAIATRFTEVSASLGVDTAARVNTALDDYAGRWAALAHDACAATHVRHEQSEQLLDRRSACLHVRRASLASVAARFEQADDAIVHHAADAIAGLPELSRCEDDAALLAAVAPPDDAAVAREVEAVRDALAAAEVDGHLGRYAQAYEDTAVLDTRARAAGYRPLVAEVKALRGDLAQMAGLTADGRRLLEDAAHGALAVGDDALFVRAATELVGTVGLGLSRYDDALAWAGHAAAMLERLHDGDGARAGLAQAMCKVLADKGDGVFALAQCVRALALAQARWGPDSLHTARAHQALGMGYFALGRYAEAEAEFTRVETIVARDKGEHHPDYAQIGNALSATCYHQHGASACLDRFRRVVELTEQALGTEHEGVADVTNNLAIVLVEAGLLDEAERRATRALALRRRDYGDDHPGVGASLVALASVAQARGELQRAATLNDEGLAIYRDTRGPRHPDVAATLHQGASIRLALGDRAGARAQATEALELARELGRPRVEQDELRTLLAATEH